MLLEKLKKYKLVLASRSPRRQYLLKELGLTFDVIVSGEISETFPSGLKRENIVLYLSRLKAESYIKNPRLQDNTLLITADTIVWMDNEVINKPEHHDDAIAMLKKLSGRKHTVYSGVSLTSKYKTVDFHSRTDVYFKNLSDQEIHYYVDAFKPYDKAGAYGIQEWIGYIGIEKIEGSYFNVMGLPVQKLYDELMKF